MNRTFQIVKNKEKIAEILFIAGIALELLVMMTDHFASWTIPLRGRITHVAFILFCLKIICTEYKYKWWILTGILGIIGAISYFTAGDEYVIRAVVMVIASKDVDIDRIVKIILYTSVAGTILIVLLSILHVTGIVVDIRDYGRGVEEARYCFGFNHANNVHDMLWYILCMYLFIQKNRLKIVQYLAIIVGNIGLLYFTHSRTGFLIIVIMILEIAFVEVIDKNWARLLVCFGSIIEMFSVLWLTHRATKYDIIHDKFVHDVDPIFNGRLEMVYEFANPYARGGWAMFPIDRKAEHVDNGFAILVYSYGTVVTVFLIVAILWALVKAYKKNNMMLLIILASSVIVLFMEATYMLNVSLLCNVILIVFMYCMNIDSKYDGKIKTSD